MSEGDTEALLIMGNRLREARTSRNLSVPQLVTVIKKKLGSKDSTGFNTNSIQTAERGERALTPYRIAVLAEYFKLPISWFYGQTLADREALLLSKAKLNIKLTPSENSFFMPYKLMEIPAGAQATVSPVSSLRQDGFYKLNTAEGDYDLFHIRATGGTFAVSSSKSVDVLTVEQLAALESRYVLMERILNYTVMI